MRRIQLLFFVVFFSSVASAQHQFEARKSFNTPKGRFTIYRYSENIYKIKFEPEGYKKGEQVSDAVILKMPGVTGATIDGKLQRDTVFLLGKAVIVGTHEGDGYRGFYLPLQGDELIFGGGERALPLNRRGYRLNLYNNPWYGYSEGADDLNYSVPFITSSKGYGLFFDNPSKSYVDIGKANKNILEYGASSGELNVYVIFGDYQSVLQSYYKLTGTQPLPPRWAFGNLMSRFGYTSESQVKGILSKMKDQHIPVDAIIFDLFWFGDSIKHSLGDLEWTNKQAWPDPKRMIGDFRKEGISTILVTEPFFVETSKNYQASKPYLAVDSTGRPYYLTDFYFGKGGLVDIFRSDSRQWFWQFYKKQMNIGVEAWWGDLGEPEKHPADLYHNFKDYGYNRLFKSDEVHNLYGHTWTKMLYEHYAKEFPNKRLFSLNRSGFSGSQRYSIFPWTGDVSRSWSGFRAQLPVLLGMSMSGVPYVHSDAGGFAGGEGDNELYVRWLQFAVFTPIFRPHGTALYEKDPTAFSFPSEAALIDTPYRDMAKHAINMRYSYLPYNYSLAYQQTKYGKPLMAPLYYYFPNDTTALKIQDEYMWGENILVAPVLDKGANTRTYYLPGGNWYSMTSKKFVEGARWLTDPVTLKGIPVFVKEGGFVPVLENPAYNNSTKLKLDTLAFLYTVSDKASSYQLYDDDGVGKNNIRNNDFELIDLVSTGKKDNQLIISIHSEGNYRTRLSKRNFGFVIPNNDGKPGKILVNGKELMMTVDHMNNGKNICVCDEHLISFRLDYTGAPVTIKIIW